MAMLMPMRRNRNLLSELMSDPFDAFFDAATAPVQAMQKMSPSLMRTDIKETDAGFELTIDLPGFKKDDVQGRTQGRLPHHRRADAKRKRGQGREGHVRPQGAFQRQVQPHVLRGRRHRRGRHPREVRGRRAEDRRSEEAGAAQARREEDHRHRGLALRGAMRLPC